MMKHENFKERKKAVQIVSKRSAVIAQRCGIASRVNSNTLLKIRLGGIYSTSAY